MAHVLKDDLPIYFLEHFSFDDSVQNQRIDAKTNAFEADLQAYNYKTILDRTRASNLSESGAKELKRKTLHPKLKNGEKEEERGRSQINVPKTTKLKFGSLSRKNSHRKFSRSPMKNFTRSKSTNEIKPKQSDKFAQKKDKKAQVENIFMNSWVDHRLMYNSKNDNTMSSRNNNFIRNEINMSKMSNSGVCCYRLIFSFFTFKAVSTKGFE